VSKLFERHHEIMERRNSGEASEYGFTLIELLIVIIVLGILAAIVVFSLSGVSGQSKTAACTTDAKTVEVAADAYQAKTGNWPASAADATALVTANYLKSVPSTTNGYTIGIGGSGIVTVTEGGTTTNFDDQTGCPAITS
jgi:prepilin-type N-terminal cleavage/methylation domain-containing protein